MCASANGELTWAYVRAFLFSAGLAPLPIHTNSSLPVSTMKTGRGVGRGREKEGRDERGNARGRRRVTITSR